MNDRYTILAALALAIPLSSPGFAADERAFNVQHEIQSSHPDQARTFSVHLPQSYFDQSRFDYPVLVLLDGETNLDHASAVASFLAENAVIPEMLIVAVNAGPTRTRDYLPPSAGARGRADQFLDFISQELLPFVDEHYRAAPFRVLSGHSYGGVLVTYALAERPGLFQGYVAQSPYLDAQIGAPLIERVAATLAENPNLAVFFYMNLGDEAALEPSFSRLKSALERAAPGSVRWAAEIYTGKTHMTTRMLGLYDGLERLFAPDWPLAQETLIADRAAALPAHIESLSRRYRYPVLYSESVFRQATQIYLSQQDAKAAAESARLYVSQYADSAVAHFLLASALVAGNEREEARTAIRAALDLYRQNPRPDWEPLVPSMTRLQQMVAD